MKNVFPPFAIGIFVGFMFFSFFFNLTFAQQAENKSNFIHDKKIKLIRKLLKKRIESNPKLNANKPPDFDVNTFPETMLIGLPEATIVYIVESYWMLKNYSQMSDKAIFAVIDEHRNKISDEKTTLSFEKTYSESWKRYFKMSDSNMVIIKLLDKLNWNFKNAGETPQNLTLTSYIKYRLSIEHSHGAPISNQFVNEAIEEATQLFRSQ
jgi:hypothetical protein